MLDTIYIVDEKCQENPLENEGTKEYKPNFIIKDGKNINLTEKNDDYDYIKRIALHAGMFIAPLPTAIISSIISFTPGILDLFSDKNTSTEESDEQQKIKYREAKELFERIQRLSLSPTEAKRAGYKFQPGHPLIGKAYRRHPLADHDEKNKANLYIPSDCYNKILLEERESEMIKLLVHLGATKIVITKKLDHNNEDASTLQAGISSKVPVGASADYSERQRTHLNYMDTREFTLSGNKWTPESKVERSQFFWLEYEPSWNAVVYAREHGGCLTASLELNEITSFSVDKNIGSNIKAKMLELEAHINFETSDTTNDVYYISATFSPTISDVV
ncbi:hypothetical protein [Dickeya zeae]|uniref:hypothetical protein n=1 Tax=Dickeya zeae TaxID=204042 RepID=UPI002097260D|nr:hypothetical protein [Dickeya zeae]MCO7262243.1 hypothetical protein [Dickeya zeae]